MLLKECRRCKVPIIYPKIYCDTCKDIVDKIREEARLKYSKQANSKYNKKRDPKYTRFYSSTDWKILSRKYMQDREYKCEECKKMAGEVHHIKAIQTTEGWERRLDYNNLKALCIDCHNHKHDRFKANIRRK